MRKFLTLVTLATIACAAQAQASRPILPGSVYAEAADPDEDAAIAAKCRELGPRACAAKADNRHNMLLLASYPDEAAFAADRAQALRHATNRRQVDARYAAALVRLRAIWAHRQGPTKALYLPR